VITRGESVGQHESRKRRHEARKGRRLTALALAPSDCKRAAACATADIEVGRSSERKGRTRNTPLFTRWRAPLRVRAFDHVVGGLPDQMPDIVDGD
jgi:hypothetical protein